MRSDLVFLASRHVQNRFLLCHWVRVASRRFHKTGDPIQDTISKVLELATQQSEQDGKIREVVSLDSNSPLRHSAKSPAASARFSEPIRNVG